MPNNSKIAKNTVLLYVRMLIVMAVGLYTSRVILNVLGVSDYGIYNLVAGFVSMIAYVNSVFVSSTQRFISFSLGHSDEKEQSKVFSTSVTVHYSMCAIVLLLAETVGLWFLNTQLNIETERMFAANVVYQLSILSLLINIVSVPYNATIVAHEHMNVYAYVSIFECVAKLASVYMLVVLSFDKLILHSILWLSISIVVRYIYIVYCRKNFVECQFHFIWDKSLIKKMASYAGWTAFGTLGFTFKDQAINVLLNIFLGTFINAARGIAMQVNGIINLFATNFFMAVQPQITKRYAAGNIEESRELVYYSSRLAFFLLSIIVIPLLFNLQHVLKLWLGDVPEYTYQFLVIILLSTIIGTMASPITTAIQATGKIKYFQIGIALLFMSEIPIAYLLLKLGFNPYLVVLPAIVTQFIGVFFRFFVLQRLVPGYSLMYFMKSIVLKCLLIFATCFFLCFLVQAFIDKYELMWYISLIMSFSISGFIIYVFGLNDKEKSTLKRYAFRYIKKK